MINAAIHIRKMIRVVPKTRPAGIRVKPTVAISLQARQGPDWDSIQVIPKIVALEKHRYFPLAMKSLWKASIVSDVFLHERAAQRMDKFVFVENEGLLKKGGGKTTSIGGFMLGRAIFDEMKQSYQVTIERFLDIESDNSNARQIEFGIRAWSKLGDAMDIYKDEGIELVGWFQTRPGAGSFLSPSDINMHLTQFRKPYQFVVELDGLQSREMGHHHFSIFTYDSNNVRNLSSAKTGPSFRWNEVQKWLYLPRI